MERSTNLLDLALGLDNQHLGPWPLSGRVVLIEDSVETSGSFVLHHFIKRVLSANSGNALVVFLSFAHPFSHYDRILRKLGCNLTTQSENEKFIFFDMLVMQCPDGDERKDGAGGLAELFGKIQKIISGFSNVENNHVTIMIDDVSLLEVAANGASNHVLDFLHYCHSLTSEYDCSLVILNHGDIYSSMERPAFMLQMVYLADILIKAEPLATGLANDVHGQLTVLNKEMCYQHGSSKNKLHNFHFRVKENGVEYFYPGSRS